MSMLLRAPAPAGRAYVGHRNPDQAGPGTVEIVELNGSRAYLDPRNDLQDKSEGFQWGYGGSGPAQLALALVADATGDDALALKVFQRFKFEIVTGLPDQWQLDADNIAAFARTLAHVPEEQL